MNATDLKPFDPSLAVLEHKRPSTTQGSVVIKYMGEEIGHFGDDIELVKEGPKKGQYFGRGYEYWLAVAKSQAIIKGLCADDTETPTCSSCRCTFEDGGDGYLGLCPTCADGESYKLSDQDHATILAALRYWQQSGMGDPDNRSEDLHFIATNCGDVISLDDEGIDELCERLNEG